MSKRVAVIGASGFVGSAFKRAARDNKSIELTEVTRASYDDAKRYKYDIVVNASNNSKKYISDREPLLDFDLSVTQQMRVLQDFPAPYHILLSSVDVYSNLASYDATKEDTSVDLAKTSHYGLHKYLAEQCVQHYAPNWLIVRLAGMVGRNLKKNPVFDILNRQPLRIHPDSEYQFMHTSDVARIVLRMMSIEVQGEVLNLCGKGLVTPRQVAKMANAPMNLSELPEVSVPRYVRINTSKLEGMMPLPESEEAIRRFLDEESI